jgi:hypothetical protein
VEVFQQSSGRSVLKDRLVAKFSGKTGAFTWNGRSRTGRLKDGYYYARFTMKLEDGAKDVRLVALRRSHGRFAGAPTFAQKTSCGVFTDYRLSGAVFGGARNVPLRLTYKLAHDVSGVQVSIYLGRKRIRRFARSGDSAKPVSISLPAGAVPRGAVVTVRSAITDASGHGATLTAKRL